MVIRFNCTRVCILSLLVNGLHIVVVDDDVTFLEHLSVTQGKNKQVYEWCDSRSENMEHKACKECKALNIHLALNLTVIITGCLEHCMQIV